MENLQNSSLVSITPELAKEMIKSLYVKLKDTNTNALSLFRRSYALDFGDLMKLISVVENHDDKLTKIRIYPAFRDEHLTFILMIEHDGVMIWDSSSPTSPQAAIQDQLFPCPTICPGSGDLFTENEWKRITT